MNDDMKAGITNALKQVAKDDITIINLDTKNSSSWRKRGGVGAFFKLATEWDIIEDAKKENPTKNMFELVKENNRQFESLIEAVRNLRRYAILVEAEVRRPSGTIDAYVKTVVQADMEWMEKLKKESGFGYFLSGDFFKELKEKWDALETAAKQQPMKYDIFGAVNGGGTRGELIYYYPLSSLRIRLYFLEAFLLASGVDLEASYTGRLR